MSFLEQFTSKFVSLLIIVGLVLVTVVLSLVLAVQVGGFKINSSSAGGGVGGVDQVTGRRKTARVVEGLQLLLVQVILYC